MTVTVYVPTVGEEQDSVEVWLVPRAMLAGDRVHVKSVGETSDVSDTVPVKSPLTWAAAIVAVSVAPALTLTVVGLADSEKSGGGTVMVTVAVWVRSPLLPVTVTV